MPQEINLIPQEVVKERSRQSSQTKFVLFSLVFLFIAGILTVVSGLLATTSSASLSSIKDEVNQKEQKIKSLEEVEKSASVLQQRLGFIKGLFDNKIVYSKILNELEVRLINGIALTDVEVTPDYAITISGVASSTTILQNYVKNLVSEGSLFSDLKIIEVNIKEGKGTVDFKVQATVDKTKVVGFK